MKKALLLSLVLVFGASMAFAQAGSIGIFADNAGLGCNLADPGPALTPYYIVHVNTPGATASQYSAPKPTCFTAQWLSDTNAFPVTVGNSQIGVSVGYGSCKVSPILLQTLNYFTNGATPNCCYYPVLADPTATPPGIYVVDCQDQLLTATGGKGIIKSLQTCNCNVPAEETTWGQVKALYE